MTDSLSNTRLNRRRLLEATTGLTLAGLSGCLAAGGGSGENPSGTQPGTDENSSGHGEDAHQHDSVSEPKANREVLVNTTTNEDTTEHHFDPHVTWVTVGGTVTWTLEGGTHTATAYHPENDEPRLVPEGTDAWDSGTLTEHGETYEHTFDTEGVYHYFCEPHEQLAMIGTVIVGNPHPDHQIALQELPSGKPDVVQRKLKDLNEMCRSMLGGDHHDDTTADEHHDDTTADEHHDVRTVRTG